MKSLDLAGSPERSNWRGRGPLRGWDSGEENSDCWQARDPVGSGKRCAPSGTRVGPRLGARGGRSSGPKPQAPRRAAAAPLGLAGPLAPPRPARGASWVRGGAGAAPLSGVRGRRDRVAAEGWRLVPRRSAPPRPAPAGMADLLPPGPPSDEQDFIQAYEEVRERYKGTAPSALAGPPA